MKKAIVYQTLNLVTNKFYIGIHLQENPERFDGYLGCGFYAHRNHFLLNPQVPFHFAVKQYGVKNFKRTTLAVFDSYDEALKLENAIVTNAFINRLDTYNTKKDYPYLFEINQFTKDGTLLATWDSCKEIGESFGIDSSIVYKAIIKKESCLGYYWSQDKVINPSQFKYLKGTRVYQYSKSKKFIQVFEYTSRIDDAISKAIKSQELYNDHYWSLKHAEEFVYKIHNIKGKTIYAYDLEGNFLAELQPGKGVREYFGTNSISHVKQAILKNKPLNGKQASLTKVDKMPEAVIYPAPKRVGKFSMDGNLIKEYNSIKAATLEEGSGVIKVLKGLQSHTHNFIFKYLD